MNVECHAALRHVRGPSTKKLSKGKLAKKQRAQFLKVSRSARALTAGLPHASGHDANPVLEIRHLDAYHQRIAERGTTVSAAQPVKAAGRVVS